MRYKPIMVGFLKNKLNDRNLFHFMNKLPQQWTAITNNTADYRGRILLIWDQRIWTIMKISESKQHLAVEATNAGGCNFFLTASHATNQQVERETLWRQKFLESQTVNAA